jgi:adenylate cyclase class 2
VQTEIEAKFLNTNHDALRQKLTATGAQCVQPMRLMRRKLFDYQDNRLNHEQNGWVRLRDEGDKTTLAYKQLNDRTLHGTKEVTVEVDNFDTTGNLLEQIGLMQKSYQETRRESWELEGAQIELDEWPWIKPFMEIEAPTEAILRTVADRLGLDMAVAVYGSVEVAYQAEYDVTDEEIDAWQEALFGKVPAWLEEKRK